MRIEHMTFQKLKDLSDAELHNLRSRFINIFNRYFAGSDIQKAVNIERKMLLTKYITLRSEMGKRGLKLFRETALDTEIYNRIFKSSIWDLDVPSLGDVAIIPEYISIGGSYVQNPKEASDVDIIIREDSKNRDESLELKVGRLIKDQTKKDIHFVYAPRGPHSSYIPLFDLILRAKEDTSKIKVKESVVAKGLTEAQRRECDAETEKIKESKKTAKYPHKFKPAKYTHPNGHPRCLLCGQEEREGGLCHKPTEKSQDQEHEYYERLDDWDEAYIQDNEEVTKALTEGSILDLGCGACKLLLQLQKKGHETHGIDKSDIALEICKTRGIKATKADLEKKLSMENASYDNVIAIHSLEHLEKPDGLIKEATRIARKKAIILSPLGERLDPGHKQEFLTLEEFKNMFPEGWRVKELKSNSALAILDLETLKQTLRPFGKFVPPKPTMAGLTEAFSIDEIWDWANKRLPLAIEEKLNSFRFVIEKEGDKIRLQTEGKKDRTQQLSNLVEVLKKIPDDFILDCGIGIDRKGEPLPRIKLMTIMAEKPELKEGDVIKAMLFDIPYWKEDIHEKPLEERRNQLEKFFNQHLKRNPHFGLTNFIIVKNREELERAFRRLARLPQSEGILIKTLDGPWDPDGSADTWAKLKNEAEIKVIALARHEVKGGNFNYTSGLLPGDTDYKNLTEYRGQKYIDLGNTYNTKLKAEPGDILTMGVEEIIPQEDKLQWLGPRVLDIDKDRKTPYFASQAIDIARRANVLQKSHRQDKCMNCSNDPEVECLWAEGFGHAWFCNKCFKTWATEGDGKDEVISVKMIQNGKANSRFKDNKSPNIESQFDFLKSEEGGVDYKIGDEGQGVLQLHMMGIEEEEIEALKKVSQESARSRHNFLRLKMLLKGAVGEKGSHIDMRLVKKGQKYFEGGEILIGNLSGFDKLKKFEEGGKLRFEWKVPRKEEPEAETVRGPVSWMAAGKGKIELFPPGEAGATTHKYGAMLLLDEFAWEAIEPQDKHAKKFEFKGLKLIPEGTYLMAYVPVTPAGERGERVWMISKLKEQEAKKSFFRIVKVDKKMQIVGGIIYEPDTVDTQGDYTDRKEIEKAMYRFMEKYATDSKRIKINHKGKKYIFPILESYIPDHDTHKGGEPLKAGCWWLMLKVVDKDIWNEIEKGQLTGFSLGGKAKA